MDIVTLGVFACHFQGFRRDIPCRHLSLRHLGSQRNSDTTRTRTDIQYFGSGRQQTFTDCPWLSVVVRCYDPLAEFLRFRSRNQHMLIDQKRASAKVGMAQNILDGGTLKESLCDFLQFCLAICR